MAKQADWKLLGLWIVVPSLVGTLSLAVPIFLISGMPYYSFVGDNALGPLFVLAFCLVAITGSLIGLAQGLILKRWLSRAILYLPGIWMIITAVGVFLGLITAVVVNASFLWVGGTVLPGFVLGWMQWLLLKSCFLKAGRWVLTCGVAWMASLIVVWLLYLAFPPMFDYSALPDISTGTLLFAGITSFAGLLVFSLITGLVLMSLHSIESPTQTSKSESQ